MGNAPRKVDIHVFLEYHPPKAFMFQEQDRDSAIGQLRRDLAELLLPMPKADSIRFPQGMVCFMWSEQPTNGTLSHQLKLKINQAENLPPAEQLSGLLIKWITLRIGNRPGTPVSFTRPPASAAQFANHYISPSRHLKRESSPGPLPLSKRIKMESPSPSSASSFTSMHVSTPADSASTATPPPPPPATAEQIVENLHRLRKAMQLAASKEQSLVQSLQDLNYPVPANITSNAKADLQADRESLAVMKERLETAENALKKANGELTKERLNLLQTQRNASSSCDTLAEDLLTWQKEKTDLQAEALSLKQKLETLQEKRNNLDREVEREARMRREAIGERDRAYSNFAREREARAQDQKSMEEWRALRLKLDKVSGILDKERKLREDVQTELIKERRRYNDAQDEIMELKKTLGAMEREQDDIRMECREPFIVPALFDMLKMLSRTTTESIDRLPIHVD